MDLFVDESLREAVRSGPGRAPDFVYSNMNPMEGARLSYRAILSLRVLSVFEDDAAFRYWM